MSGPVWIKLLSQALSLGIPALVKAIKKRRARKKKKDLGVSVEDINKVTDPFLQELAKKIDKKG